MQFRKPEITDIPVMRPFYEEYGSHICDYTIGTTFMWRHFYGTEYCIEDGVLFIRTQMRRSAQPRYLYQIPVGAADPRREIARIIALEHENGRKAAFAPVEERFLPLFENQDAVFEFDDHDGAFADYVYDYDAFLNLSGKKNHKKKNHIHQFDRFCGSWHLQEITPRMTEELKHFLKTGYAPAEDAGRVEREEMRAVHEVLEHYAQYGMQGAVLYADERIAGFTAGERIGDTLFIHIEKADKTIPGAYQKLNHEFAVRYGQGMKWINREDDSGDEGLRRSKLSYHPDRMEQKYLAAEAGMMKPAHGKRR